VSFGLQPWDDACAQERAFPYSGAPVQDERPMREDPRGDRFDFLFTAEKEGRVLFRVVTPITMGFIPEKSRANSRTSYSLKHV